MCWMKLFFHVQTSTVGMNKQFHPTAYKARDYLSMLGMMLNHVSKRGPLYMDNLDNTVFFDAQTGSQVPPYWHVTIHLHVYVSNLI